MLLSLNLVTCNLRVIQPATHVGGDVDWCCVLEQQLNDPDVIPPTGHMQRRHPVLQTAYIHELSITAPRHSVYFTSFTAAFVPASYQLLVPRKLNRHHHCRVAGDGRRVVAPPCPRSTARLQRSPIKRVESFRSWSSHLFRGRSGGRRHVWSGGLLSDTLMWS